MKYIFLVVTVHLQGSDSELAKLISIFFVQRFRENAEIPELRRKVAEVKAENAKLKQIIEKNARHDARVEKLEQKNIELETRLAILEQDSLEVNGQPQNDNEVPPYCICSDIEIKVVTESTEKCFAKDLLPEVTLPPIFDYSQGKQDQYDNATSPPSCMTA